MKLICDDCLNPIEYLEDGWVEWLSGPGVGAKLWGFRIVHHGGATSCPYYRRRLPDDAHEEDHHLDYFVWCMRHAPGKLDRLLAALAKGDPGFGPFTAIERLRLGARLPKRTTIDHTKVYTRMQEDGW